MGRSVGSGSRPQVPLISSLGNPVNETSSVAKGVKEFPMIYRKKTTTGNGHKKYLGGGNSNIFYVHPYLGNDPI